MSGHSSLRSEIVVGLFASLITVAAGLFTSIVTARGMTPEDRGAFIAVVLWTGLLSIVAVFGLDDAVIFLSGGKRTRANTITSSLRAYWMGLTVLSLILTTAILLAVVPSHGRWMYSSLLASIVISSNVFTQVSFAKMRSQGLVVRWALLQTISPLTYLIGVAVGWKLGILDYANALLFWMSASILALVIARLLVGGPCAHDSSPSRQYPVRDALAYGARNMQGVLPQQGSNRAPQLIVGFVGDMPALSVYAVAASVSMVIQSAALMVEKVLFARLSGAATVYASFSRRLAVSVALSMVFAVPAFVFAPYAVRFAYGEQYMGAVAPMRILILAGVGAVAMAAMAAEAKSLNHLGVIRDSQLLNLFTTTVLCLLLFSSLGVVGLATAALAGGLLAAVVTFIRLKTCIRG